MSFLHPEFLFLAPLLAIPVLIHLLNRVRYRRIRWAAIEFLLATERRAVRRARLRQILLMILRTMVLAAALGALAQPIFSGAVASLLGGSTQVAVVVDASASMSAEGVSGSAFDRALKSAAAEVKALPNGTRVAAGSFAVGYDSPLHEPIQDHGAVAEFIKETTLTGGGTDVPQALKAAAETLAQGGGGGTLWLLTDMREGGWRAGGPGAWDEVRQALAKAGKPRLIISDVAPPVSANFSISKIRLTPEILMENDEPRLTATIKYEGTNGGATSVRLFFEDKHQETRPIQFTEPGSTDLTFRLPAVKGPAQCGYLELEHDAVPEDDRFYFVLRPAGSVPVLVVSGEVSSAEFESSGDLLALAFQPPAPESGARSPFTIKKVAARDLGNQVLSTYAAVCLADMPRVDADTAKMLRAYVEGGGLLMIFPGARTDVASWNEAGLLGAKIEGQVEAGGEKHFKVTGASPNNPVTATLPMEGLERLLVNRYFRLSAEPAAEVLATFEGGEPFMLRTNLKKGKVYAFAVSCQNDFSNLPFTPVLLLSVHRMMLGHLGDIGDPATTTTGTVFEFPMKAGSHRIIMPDGHAAPLTVREDKPGKALFDRTQAAGIYRLADSDSDEALKAAVPVRALNAPPEESSLVRIAPSEVRELLAGSSVFFLESEGNISQVESDTSHSSAISGFPLAVLALMLLLGEVLVAWSMGRPVPARKGAASASSTNAQ
jgi:hypothetical protein